jgi:hypothetical protein
MYGGVPPCPSSAREIDNEAITGAACIYGPGPCEEFIFGVRAVDLGLDSVGIDNSYCRCESGCPPFPGGGKATEWTYELAISERGGPYQVFATLQEGDWDNNRYVHRFRSSYELAMIRMQVYEDEALIGTAYSTYPVRIQGRLRVREERMMETGPGLKGVTLDVQTPSLGSSEINFEVEEPVEVRIAVYDARGRCVRRLMNGLVGPGEHTVSWDGRDNKGQQVTSGVFFLRMESGGQGLTRKVVVAR